jgi:hypothetical protein
MRPLEKGECSCTCLKSTPASTSAPTSLMCHSGPPVNSPAAPVSHIATPEPSDTGLKLQARPLQARTPSLSTVESSPAIATASTLQMQLKSQLKPMFMALLIFLENERKKEMEAQSQSDKKGNREVKNLEWFMNDDSRGGQTSHGTQKGRGSNVVS